MLAEARCSFMQKKVIFYVSRSNKGNISRSLLLFALPMMAGNLLQQFYNIADTLIVGRVLGRDALAAVGSAYTLMTFLTSIFLGLSLGSGALFSIYKGRGDEKTLKSSVFHAFVLIMAVTVVLNILVYLGLDGILAFLKVPEEVWQGMRQYLLIIFAGLIATSLYNFFACLLRAMGNSTVPLVFLAVSTVINIVLDLLFVATVPLVFLAVSTVINIVLDLLFVVVWSMGIGGAALATIIAQYISGLGITVFALRCCPQVIPKKSELKWNGGILKEIVNLSSMTCIQQSVMNFGILMVQGLVNSFGPVVMAAFAAAVKIDSFAYLPVQDFGNAYSTFIAQNYGAGNRERIKKGTKQAFALSILFCIFISALVFIFAGQLMGIFVSKAETEVIACGIKYLRVEGAFYWGIGCLFLFYGYYRAVKRAGMSVVLTVISLGMRVLLAYVLSAKVGEVGIWAAIPIGWVLADITGLVCMLRSKL